MLTTVGKHFPGNFMHNTHVNAVSQMLYTEACLFDIKLVVYNFEIETDKDLLSVYKPVVQ